MVNDCSFKKVMYTSICAYNNNKYGYWIWVIYMYYVGISHEYFYVELKGERGKIKSIVHVYIH